MKTPTQAIADMRRAYSEFMRTAAECVAAIECHAGIKMKRAGTLGAVPLPECPPRAVAIQEAVAKYYGLTREHLISTSRLSHIVLPRHIAVFLCCELTTAPNLHVARWFARDHGSVYHAVRSIRSRTADRNFVAELQRVRVLVATRLKESAPVLRVA